MLSYQTANFGARAKQADEAGIADKSGVIDGSAKKAKRKDASEERSSKNS